MDIGHAIMAVVVVAAAPAAAAVAVVEYFSTWVSPEPMYGLVFKLRPLLCPMAQARRHRQEEEKSRSALARLKEKNEELEAQPNMYREEGICIEGQMPSLVSDFSREIRAKQERDPFTDLRRLQQF